MNERDTLRTVIRRSRAFSAKLKTRSATAINRIAENCCRIVFYREHVFKSVSSSEGSLPDVARLAVYFEHFVRLAYKTCFILSLQNPAPFSVPSRSPVRYPAPENIRKNSPVALVQSLQCEINSSPSDSLAKSLL